MNWLEWIGVTAVILGFFVLWNVVFPYASKHSTR
jgi:hypothetical protein